jgi:para-aminobenzoate synthetase component I
MLKRLTPFLHLPTFTLVRLSKTFHTSDLEIKRRLLHWASSKHTCCLLNSNQDKQSFEDPYSQHDFILAVNAHEVIADGNQPFEALKQMADATNDYLFGYFTYDLKNKIENLTSNHPDELEFPEIFFFQPEFVITLTEEKVKIEYLEKCSSSEAVIELFEEIINTSIEDSSNMPFVQQRVSKEQYISTVKKIKEHIQRGDIYEMNYCMEFYAEAGINPAEIYWKLNEMSPMPFSAFFKKGDLYLMCASPERFMAKRGEKIISQPIKGTAKRGKTKEEDERIKISLRKSAKEQSENVMIVDLVRNDLSRTAKQASVEVEDLCAIYSFRQLHQMISTVTSEIRSDAHFADVIKYAFPMGSMTGAPKIRAMELIEQYENTLRGLYSGSIGYISPAKNFDFNVVIRSILYNAKKKYLSFMVGSAITANSDEENEYEECMLKAKSMLDVLTTSKPKRKKFPQSLS